MQSAYTITEMSHVLSKTPLEIFNIQKNFCLKIFDKKDKYSEPYLNFLKKILFFKALHIPQKNIENLFDVEKKIIQLLHGDTVSGSATWYLDSCIDLSLSKKRLLLTGYNLGFSVNGIGIQDGLDFKKAEKELFASEAMGVDVIREIKKYMGLFKDYQTFINGNLILLIEAITWCSKTFKIPKKKNKDKKTPVDKTNKQKAPELFD